MLKPKTDIESIDSDSSYCYSGKYKMVIAPKTFVRYRNLLDGIDHTTVEIFSFKLRCESRSCLFWRINPAAYSHDIDPHSYDVDPLEEGMAFKEQSLFACKQAVVQLYKDITFSFSWTLHRE